MSQQSYENQFYTYWVCGASQLFLRIFQGNKTIAEKKNTGWEGFSPTWYAVRVTIRYSQLPYLVAVLQAIG